MIGEPYGSGHGNRPFSGKKAIGMKYRFLVLTIALLLWVAPAPFLLAAEVTRVTAIEVSGKMRNWASRSTRDVIGVNVRNAGDEVYLVDIDVAGVKRLSARSTTLRNRCRSGSAVSQAAIPSGSACRTSRLFAGSIRPCRTTGRAGDALLSLTSYIAEAQHCAARS